MTKARRLVAETALLIIGPIRQHEFCEYLVNEPGSKSISRATVYRVLSDMKEAGLIRIAEEDNFTPPA